MIRQFPIVFDHASDQLLEVQDFGSDAVSAIRAYDEKERSLPRDSKLEVVLIGSDSIETIRKTHANYFGGSSNISRYLDLSGVG